MSESPRWERESHEDLSAPQPTPQPSDPVDLDLEATGLVDPSDLADPPEYDDEDTAESAALPEPRLAGARESLAATRESARESLAVTRENARESLAATRERTRESLSATRESLSSAAGSLSSAAGRAGRFIAALDRRPEFDPHHRRDPIAQLNAGSIAASPAAIDTDDDDAPRFPLASRGYDRDAVDGCVAALEAELAVLRDRAAGPISITEEIERLGEQAASILVTAHDTAHQTARVAQQQAARAVSDAASDADRITMDAQRRLRELDEETDAVWRERERLLDDVRDVSAALATLAQSASERFPGDAPDEEPAAERPDGEPVAAGVAQP